MAQYMLLLYDDDSWYDDITPERWDEAMKLHGEFTEAAEAAGARILGGEQALERSSTATTVRRDWDNLVSRPRRE